MRFPITVLSGSVTGAGIALCFLSAGLGAAVIGLGLALGVVCILTESEGL